MLGDISVIPWYKEFWRDKPDYIIVQWEKNHRFTNIIDYYRKHEEPIWLTFKNDVIYSGIYRFHLDLNYQKINNGHIL